ETSYNSSTYYQNSSRIYYQKCGGSVTDDSLNFKVYDERNLSRLTDIDINGFFEFYLGEGTVKRNSTVSENNIDELEMCILPTNLNLTLDADIEYDFLNNTNLTYGKRNYYFDGATVNSDVQDIKLYLLNSEYSTSFIQEVEDQQTSSVPGALIHTQRFYPGDGIYRTVQISKTDDNGKSVGFYEVEEVDYKHIIMLDREVILETESGKIVPESVPYTLIFKTGEALLYPWNILEGNPEISTSLNFNESTNITTYSWIDSSGSVTSGNLLVYQEKHDAKNLLICNQSASFSSGSVTCDVSGYEGSFIAIGSVQPDTMTDLINFVISTAKDIFGNTGIIIGFFIILTAGLAFIWNPTAMIIALNAATIFVNLIGFISFGGIYIFAMIGISIIAIIFLRT
ncbi:MAG: hypothetical protein ACOC5T_04055, partial [Elusimicrobiota bacterium]